MKACGTPSLAIIAMLGLLTSGASAYASLGDSAASIEKDRKNLSGVHNGTKTAEGYTVQELVVGGTSIREFVSPSGVVFGLAWNGFAHPDLQKLLGGYAKEYQEQDKLHHGTHGHRHHSMKTDHVIVETSGHMRSLRGRAYLPALLPKGVTADVIE